MTRSRDNWHEPAAPEFHRPIEVARVPNLGSHEKIAADAKELKALAKRLDVPALHALSAELHVKPWRGGGFKVSGLLKADVEQVSVISLEAFRQVGNFQVERYFLPASAAHGANESDEDIDIIQGGIIDIGEVVAETLALELDPYPRKPGESFADGQGPEDENVHPFPAPKEPST